jgi:hypothetical protein
MTNQMIGIAAVFAFTFLLLGLRHCIQLLSRPNKRPYVDPATLRGRAELRAKPANYDSRLLLSPDTEAGSPSLASKNAAQTPAKAKTLLRLITGR